MDATAQVPFLKDHAEAASRLADALKPYKYSAGLVVAASSRGVIEGLIIAHTLGLPLDILLSGKIEHPFNPGQVIGIVTLYGIMLQESDVPVDNILVNLEEIKRTLYKQYVIYTGYKHPTVLSDKYIIVVDECVEANSVLPLVLPILRSQEPRKIALAVPAIAPAARPAVEPLVDELVYLFECTDCSENRLYEYPATISPEQLKYILHRNKKCLL